MTNVLKWVAVGAGAALLANKLKGNKVFASNATLATWGPYLAAGAAVAAVQHFTHIVPATV